MKVRCSHTKLVPLAKLKPHPKNTNTHTAEQVVRLAEIMAYQGVRNPIKVSKQSDFITAGHCRLLAAKHNGWTKFPVDFQDYDNEEQEIIDVTADNAIATWAEIDMALVNALVPELGPDISADMLGIDGFVLDFSELEKLPEAPPKGTEHTKETQGGNPGLATKIILYFDEQEYFRVMSAAQRLIEKEGHTDLSSLFASLLFRVTNA